MRWTWDPDKNEINRRKHGISFETAAGVFNDPLLIMFEDDDFYEDRWQTFGSVDSVTIVVIHTWPEYDPESEDTIGRIISARKATRLERIAYEEGRR